MAERASRRRPEKDASRGVKCPILVQTPTAKELSIQDRRFLFSMCLAWYAENEGFKSMHALKKRTSALATSIWSDQPDFDWSKFTMNRHGQIERTTDKALVLARIRDFCEDALEGGTVRDWLKQQGEEMAGVLAALGGGEDDDDADAEAGGTDWMAELTQFSGLLREKERSSDGKLSTSHPMLEAFLADTFSAKTAGVLLGMRGDDSVQILSCLEGIIELGVAAVGLLTPEQRAGLNGRVKKKEEGGEDGGGKAKGEDKEEAEEDEEDGPSKRARGVSSPLQSREHKKFKGSKGRLEEEDEDDDDDDERINNNQKGGEDDDSTDDKEEEEQGSKEESAARQEPPPPPPPPPADTMTFEAAMGTVPVDPGELSEAPDNVKELLDQRRGVGEVIKDQLLPQHVKSVGRGSFAGVFKIKMGGVNMAAKVTVVRKGDRVYPTSVEDMLKSLLMSSLGSPFIQSTVLEAVLPVGDLGMEALVLVMPLAEASLWHVWKAKGDGPRSWLLTQLAGWAPQIMSAVALLHRHNIVWVDAKLDNILIFLTSTGKTTAKISDFGLTSYLNEEGEAVNGHRPHPVMCAPELLHDPEYRVGRLQEAWAVSLIFAELLLGKHFHQYLRERQEAGAEGREAGAEGDGGAEGQGQAPEKAAIPADDLTVASLLKHEKAFNVRDGETRPAAEAEDRFLSELEAAMIEASRVSGETESIAEQLVVKDWLLKGLRYHVEDRMSVEEMCAELVVGDEEDDEEG